MKRTIADLRPQGNPHKWASFDGEGSRRYEPTAAEKAERGRLEAAYRARIGQALDRLRHSAETDRQYADGIVPKQAILKKPVKY